jgi:hypothetical protein
MGRIERRVFQLKLGLIQRLKMDSAKEGHFGPRAIDPI